MIEESGETCGILSWIIHENFRHEIIVKLLDVDTDLIQSFSKQRYLLERALGERFL